MHKVGELVTIPVNGKPWMLYEVTTGRGSQFKMYFRHTYDLIHPANPTEILGNVGDMHTEGYSVSQGKDLNYYGVGFMPEVDSLVAVGVSGTNEDGTDIIIEELITHITNTQEVGNQSTL